MKKVLRSFVFTFIALFFTQSLFSAMTFSGDKAYGFLLIVLGFSIVNYFFPILAGFLSLPTKGIFSIIISVGLNFMMFYLFDRVVPQFDIGQGATPNLIIFGFMLPSISLTEMWALVLSSASMALIYNGLSWLGGSPKEKK